MTYNEFIQNILDTRGRFVDKDYKGYKERHHITMKSLGGTDDKENLIDLIGSEHYEAHKLLAVENPECREAQIAWHFMCTNVGADGRHYNVSAEDWEKARMARLKFCSGENHPLYGKTGEQSPNYGKKRTNETKRKMAEAQRGNKYSLESRKKMSEAKKGKYLGKDNHMYGKHLSEETKEKLSKSHKGKYDGGKNPTARKCICDGVAFDCVKDCAQQYNVKDETMRNWLRTDKIPERFRILGLSYYVDNN